MVTVSSWSLYARAERRKALRSLAFMPQHVSFPTILTVGDVVMYSGWLKGLSAQRARTRTEECLSAVGLIALRDRRCGTLSGGMTRRLALAAALASEPEVLLLDEPTTGLDPEQRHAMVELVRGLKSAVLMSSHVVEDVADLAGDVFVIDQGRLVFNGPMTDFVAGIPEGGRRSRVEIGFLRAIGRQAAP